MNRAYRTLLALTAFLPVTILLAFLLSENLQFALGYGELVAAPIFSAALVAVVTAVNFLWALLAKRFLRYFAGRAYVRPLRIAACRRQSFSVTRDGFVWLLPFFVGSCQPQPWPCWAAAFVIAAVLLCRSETVPNSPLWAAVGVFFFDAETIDGRMVTLITLSEAIPPSGKIYVGRITDKFLLR